MELPKNTIKNPLTIIGIFAAISEISATTVLVFLPYNLQKLFIWFVMLFPIILVGLFFFVLIRKHHVLYAPSDFKSDDTFSGLIENIRSQSKEETKRKKQIEMEEIHLEYTDTEKRMQSNETMKMIINNPKMEYFIAEELAIKKLIDKYGNRFLSQKTFDLKGNKYSVDGLIHTSLELSIFEVKYFPRLRTPLNGIGKTCNYFKEMSNYIDEYKYNIISFNIIIVTPIPKEEYQELYKRLEEFKSRNDIIINFEIYDYNKLKSEFGME